MTRIGEKKGSFFFDAAVLELGPVGVVVVNARAMELSDNNATRRRSVVVVMRRGMMAQPFFQAAFVAWSNKVSAKGMIAPE